MAHSPTEFAKTKMDLRSFKIKNVKQKATMRTVDGLCRTTTVRPTMLFMTCAVVFLGVIFSPAMPSASAIEIDNDLVFDDGTDLTGSRLQRLHRHNKTSAASPLAAPTTVPHRSVPSAPVPAPEEEHPETGNGLLAALHGLGERARRTLWGGLELLGSRRRKRDVAEDEADNQLDSELDQDQVRDLQDLDQEDEEDQKEHVKASDDEDYLSDEGFSGSGQTPIIRPDDPHPRYYRITIAVQEPYVPQMTDRNSNEFRHIEQGLGQGLEDLYSDLQVELSTSVISITKDDDDVFFIMVILDLGVSNFNDEAELEHRLLDHIRKTRKLGAFTVTDNQFLFRSFEDRRITEPRCEAHQLQCRSGECLPPEARCDGRRDCKDASDELGCPSETERPVAPPEARPDTPVEPDVDEPIDRCRADDKVRCRDGSYICRVQLCDGRPDCRGGDDESNCGPPPTTLPPTPTACAQGEFACDMNRCIPAEHRCDGSQHCSDSTDEQDCPVDSRCAFDEFSCGDGICVPLDRRCDGTPDCSDYSDELPCHMCTENQWQCDKGTCIERQFYCDGRRDCPDDDDSDERNCPCTSEHFECDNKFCVPKNRTCDGFNDCQDGSDERNCLSGCKPNEFSCEDRTCIHQSLVCNRQDDCLDRSDERNCQTEACRSDQFRCHDGTCLSINQRCNTIFECETGEDETGCPDRCSAVEFRCGDGQCIDGSLHCNGSPDCSDGSDEQNCGLEAPCPVSDFTCEDNTCIPLEKQCDNVTDCPGGADEAGCGCSSGEFRCDNGRCIDIRQRCDTFDDCGDDSDESDKECGEHPTCRSDEFKCANGVCVTNSYRCDGSPDCLDGSDEHGCDDHICAKTDHVCDGNKCVSRSSLCDGIFDCLDWTDERECAGKCSLDEYRCNDGSCIPESQRCNRVPNCRDGSDEINCVDCGPNAFRCDDGNCLPEHLHCNGRDECPDASDEKGCPSVTHPCGSHEFTCGDGTCIDSRRRCDHRQDCPDHSDERDCGCQSHEFQCHSFECIDRSLRCNQIYDCRDGSDEFDCDAQTPPPTTRPPSQSCLPGQFRCRISQECLSSHLLCNKRFDCQDSSDEEDCDSKGGLNLKTYPDDQIIKEITEGREVVFQCRDEGPLRARVHWVRGNGLALPPGSRDFNGRLEMPDIQVEHSGTYICEAIGYPRETPGQRVSVHLTVEAFPEPPTRPPSACKFNEATCSNGECISKHLVCDGNFDCGDGSDEMRCNSAGCEPNEFRCNNKRCVLKTWRCDSDDDCGDRSDEEHCATNPPGSPCRFNEFQCESGIQCIPKSFHCDLQMDCLDRSDEKGCSPVYIQKPPEPMIALDPGSVLTITCTAIGVPTPEVVWRLNWGHIPSKCSTTSVRGVGTLTCPDIQESDQGAYSCEAINTRGSVFAVPDSILVVKRPTTVCPRGFFNDEARYPSECISCFCFGITTECKSANLFTYQLPPPALDYKLVSVRVEPSGAVIIRPDAPYRSSPVVSQSRSGFQLFSEERLGERTYPYFAMPENYNGNQLKSYGGYIKYTVRPEGQGIPVRAPDVIITGNGYTLLHSGRQPSFGRDNEMSIPIVYGQWYKITGSGRPGGDIPISSGNEVNATREEIMMTLSNIDNILIRGQYSEGSFLDTTFSNIAMDSAGIRNTGQGKASFVEECRCPAGYTGLSCEQCAPGFHRHQSGPWLGHCTKETVPCPPGQFGDPSRNIPCQVCPCPLTTPSNQFGQSCILDSDGRVTCECPPGYIGRRCEQCDAGYQGNPLQPGDSCTPASQCDLAGSVSPQPDGSGRCQCKKNVIGPQCNQCKENSFHLDARNELGCITCFCMGITEQCSSSSWYRQQVSASFTRSTLDFKLAESQNKGEPIVDGIRLDPNTREIVFSEFSRRSPTVYYWSLPPQFLGDKVSSYGGTLKYTIRYVPAPGGQSSRNNAPDVELISSNDIHLLYFGREQIEPDRPQVVEVPLLEQFWQRQDGQQSNREHMLMALADVDAILVKATYTTNTVEAALTQVSLDIAENRNTGQPRAMAVEQCQCPVGYRGLSCQDCDVGFTRTLGGIYLGLCEPCECNGRSEQCDPESGICSNCRENTAGQNCDECDVGYEGDPSIGPCVQESGMSGCRCDPRGSRQLSCPDGRNCICKTNVVGSSCNQCRQGTFDLSQNNIEGCLECYCSGVTDVCQESNLQRTQIPMQILGSSHGFTLTDSNRNEVIRDGFHLNIAENEISYNFFGRAQNLFWSLPRQFTGNRVTSYGGNLTVTQRYTAGPGSSPQQDKDILIVGNGITLYWSGTRGRVADRSLTFSVPLLESSWQRLVSTGPKTASRADLITVLSSVEAILIRARHASQTVSTHLSDVSLDTAVEQSTGQGIVRNVEVCRCPPGYSGTSCESCDIGYYRRYTNRQDGISVCEKCPCNGNEDSCTASSTGSVTCNCIPGYTGRFCDITESPVRPLPPDPRPTVVPTITVTIQEPLIQIVDVGSTVRFRCSGQSARLVPVQISWSKEGGELPRGRATDDSRGLLIITQVQPPDSGTYICSANDGTEVSTQRTTLTVGGSRPERPQVSISPNSQSVTEGESVEFICNARGNPAPNVRWIRVDNRPFGPQTYASGAILRIRSASRSDEGEYQCHASNSVGEDVGRTVLYVRESASQGTPLIVDPPDYNGPDGVNVRLSCRAGPDFTIRWSRAGSRELPPSARQAEGNLIIQNPTPADSGVYVCNGVSRRTGEVVNVQARVTITSGRGPPTARIEPERQKVPQGTLAELRCQVSGDPTPQIRWSKVGEDELPSGIQVTANTLRILSTQVNDRGVYVCTAQNSGGTAQASAVIDIDRRERPTLDLYPSTHQTVVAGGSALLQCRVTSGVPQPTLEWRRTDGGPLSPSVEQLSGGVLRFNQITEADRGEYICEAKNDAGTVSVTATLDVQSMPKISISPSSNVNAVVGQSVRMDCQATGTPIPLVSWTRHQPGGSNFYETQPVTSERQQSAVYAITRVQKSDEGSYSCMAKNSAGAVEERLYLTVEESNSVIPPEPSPAEPRPPAPGPGSQLYTQDVFTVPVDGQAQMRCFVQGPVNLYLEWRRTDQRPLPRNSHQDNGVLYINQVQKSDEGVYSCLGYEGRNVAFRANARLQVIAPPRIQLQPSRQVVRPGDDALIRCTATGDQPITINWSSLHRELPRSVVVHEGELRFRGIAVTDAGRYVCRARNQAGDAESTAEVIVDSNPSIGSPPRVIQKDESASVGSTVTLRCVLPADVRARSFNWSRDRLSLPRNAVVRDNILRIQNVQVQDGGHYICRANSDAGDTTTFINLQVDMGHECVQQGAFQCRSGECFHIEKVCDGIPDCRDGSDEDSCQPRRGRGLQNIALRIDPSKNIVQPGDTLDLRCMAEGDTDVSYAWSKVGGRLRENIQTSESLLRIYDVQSDNGGVYRCTVRTSSGEFSQEYVLTIQGPPGINGDAAAVETRTAPYGSTVTMDCKTELEPPVTYSWSKQGGALPRNATAQSAMLTLKNVGAQDAGTYMCSAQNQNTKLDIPTVLVVTGIVPYFAQAPKSYMVLSTLPDAYTEFNIAVSFKAERPDGLILYNGQDPDGTGDFVSLGLNASHVELRVNMGSGPVLIRSLQPITMGEWHTVHTLRDRKSVSMYVDGEGPIKGLATGRFVGLDLVEPLYVGGVPDFNQISKLSGFQGGFVGCISRLVIKSRVLDLVRESTNSHGMSICDTCENAPCQNNGVCQEATEPKGYMCFCPQGYTGVNCDRAGIACYPGVCGSGKCVNNQEGYKCFCPFGKAGTHCEQNIEISEPAFSDEAFIAYPTPKTLRSTDLLLKFKPADVEDGIVAYCSQNEDGHGDFASLAIRNKHLEFRFDTGSGPAVIRSDEELTPGQWVTAVIHRTMRMGQLTVNNKAPVTGRSPGMTRGLNLKTPLYVGGVDKQRVRIASGVQVTKGFRGCVSEVKVDNLPLDIVNSVVDAANVQDCSRGVDNNPCDDNPCRNGGICHGESDGRYSCDCQYGFSGENCETEADVCQVLRPCQNGGSCVGSTTNYKCRCPLGFGGNDCDHTVDLSTEVSFQGDGYVELSNSLLPHKTPTENENIVIEFSTSEPNGLIFWHGQTPETDGKTQDYLLLAVANGSLEFGYELGSGPALIQSTKRRVSDGLRHRVVLKRLATDGSMELDGDVTEFGKSQGILQMLNTRGNIFIGGTPNLDLMTGGNYTNGFVGCIHSLQIQKIGPINFRDSALSAVNAVPCSNHVSETNNDLS